MVDQAVSADDVSLVKPVVIVAVGGAHPLTALLDSSGCQVVTARDPASVAASARDPRVRVIVTGDSVRRAGDGLEMARRLRDEGVRVPIILVTGAGSEERAIAALRAGVDDYFNERATVAELAAGVRRWLSPSSSHPRPLSAEAGSGGVAPVPRLIGESAGIRRVRAFIARVAPYDCNVLVTGETGAGKELVATLIHRLSPRRDRPFVCINCAAIPDGLIESELFGYERGAFTGAQAPYEGKLQLADGGTVFLDEIGDMSPHAQAKILRVIETKEVYRLGGRRSIPLDVRVVVATNQDLKRLVSEGKFRPDLYFRLNIARIDVPPLRDRREDVALLVDHRIRELRPRFGVETEGFTEEGLECLRRYDWPGNVRELRNVLEAVFIAGPSRRIPASQLPEPLRQGGGDGSAGELTSERSRLLLALTETNWNKSQAAQRLRWSRMTLYRKMAKYQLTARSGTGGRERAEQTAVTA